MFTRAIVRRPAENFAAGLTSFRGNPPDFAMALAQHEAYCKALEHCGLQVVALEADSLHPDSCFVEDVAVLTRRSAILTRPGAPSRRGEVAAIRPTLELFFTNVREIAAPGTLDGGDVCEAGGHFFIGMSQRTNESGARQLSAWLAAEGYTTSFVDIRETPGILHLKSGIAWLGSSRLLVVKELEDREPFKEYSRLRVAAEDGYAANCVWVTDRLFVPAGFPRVERSLEALGLPIVPLEMSEFRKMDGGLSCLSLRF